MTWLECAQIILGSGTQYIILGSGTQYIIWEVAPWLCVDQLYVFAVWDSLRSLLCAHICISRPLLCYIILFTASWFNFQTYELTNIMLTFSSTIFRWSLLKYLRAHLLESDYLVPYYHVFKTIRFQYGETFTLKSCTKIVL